MIVVGKRQERSLLAVGLEADADLARVRLAITTKYFRYKVKSPNSAITVPIVDAISRTFCQLFTWIALAVIGRLFVSISNAILCAND